MKNKTAVLFTSILLLATSAYAVNEAQLYTFCSQQFCADGAYPYAAVIFDRAHNLYGTTQQGGASFAGTVFQLTRTSGGWTETLLHSFSGGTDGGFPVGPLVFDQQGNLYGIASTGGAGYGTVFELTPSSGGWNFSVIYTFQGGADGVVSIDSGGLALDGSGNLYGTTEMGGTAGFGTVFEVSPSNGGWTKTTLYSFAGGNDAADPLAGVSLDSSGNIFGATVGGGLYGGGAVYELTKNQNTWTESVIYNFTGGNDGSYPEFGAVTIVNSNTIYGTAAGGGPYNQGVVYELQQSDGVWTESVLYSFTGGDDGGQPFAGLSVDNKGNLFGVAAYYGANGDGTVFELANTGSGWQEQTLFAFDGTGGKYPYGSVVFDESGSIFGTAFWGGNLNCNNPPQGCGTVYELPAASAIAGPAVGLTL